MGIEMKGMVPYLEVFDMRKSIAFYCDVLGFEIVANSPLREEVLFHWALLRRDGIELMLNTAYEEGQRPDVPDARRVTAHNDTALFFSCPEVDAAYAYLREKGVAKKAPKVAPYGMKQLYLKDPDGYGLCFQWPATEQERQQAARA
jgi:glyoxylase I family protein